MFKFTLRLLATVAVGALGFEAFRLIQWLANYPSDMAVGLAIALPLFVLFVLVSFLVLIWRSVWKSVLE